MNEDTTPPTEPAATPNTIPFQTPPDIGMISKREILGDLEQTMKFLAQTEQRRQVIERFLLAVLLRSGPMALCQKDIDAAAGHHLVRKELPLEPDKTMALFSAEKNEAKPKMQIPSLV